VAVVRRTGALDAARQVARDEANKARACLHLLPTSVQREALLDLCIRSIDRSS
jgi:octaprenyl-diphosphate synthase